MIYPGCSLGKILKLERRPVEIIPDKKYAEIGIYCFGKGIFHKEPRSGLEVGNKKLFQIKEGDLILQVTFAWEGAVGLASKKEDGMHGSTRFPTFRVKEDLCYPSFLLNYFKTKEGREQLIKISPGSAGRNRVLSLKRIHEVMIPLPPIDEQRRIVARIEELAARIEEARELRRRANDDAAIALSSYLETIFEIKRKRYWTTKKLIEDHRAAIVPGQHILAGDYNSLGEGTPYLTGPADFGQKIAEIKHWTHIPKAFALPGDILITVKGAGVGKINFAPNCRAAIGRQLMAIRPNREYLLSEFLYFFLLHRFNHFKSIATATTVPGFKKNDLEMLEIPEVPIQEQRHLIDLLENLQSKLDALRRHQSETAAALDALLPAVLERAFRGEL